jgi:peptidoglycan-associated lipoprotein
MKYYTFTKNFLSTLVLVGLFQIVLMSCGGGKVTDADKLFEQRQYAAANKIYQGAIKGTKDLKEKGRIAYNVAEGYRENRDGAKAELWYKRALNYNYNEVDPTVHLRLAEALKLNNKLDEAKEQLQLYVKEKPSDVRAMEELNFMYAVDSGKYEADERVVIENFRLINSPNMDFGIAIGPKNELYFSSDRQEVTGRKTYDRTFRKFSDLMIALPKSQPRVRRGQPQGPITYEKPTLLEGEINSPYNEGAPTLDDKGRKMYYTQCNGQDGKKTNCVIIEAKKQGKGWNPGTILPFCTDSLVNYGHPAVSPDGDKIIFSMDGPQSSGKHDLFITTYVRRSRTWDDPISLGSLINTENEELFPYWYNDTTVYFASNGHPGFGGLDIFVTYFTNGEWTKPENYGQPFNTTSDDYGIVFSPNNRNPECYNSGEHGYFVSNRPGSRLDDIYEFDVKPLQFTLSGVVYNRKTNTPLADAFVSLRDITNPKDTTKVIRVKTSRDGKYKFTLDCRKQYSVIGTKRPQYTDSDVEFVSTVGVKKSTDFKQDLYLDVFPVEFSIEGIYYDLDKADIREESVPILDSLFTILDVYYFLVVELGSHTDCRASIAYNDSLSNERAKSVVNYLTEKGIEIERLVPKGYGERQLVNDCECEPNNVGKGANCSEEEHQQNRRTTFKVLRNDYVPKPKEEIKEPELEEAPEEEAPKEEGDQDKPEKPEDGDSEDEGVAPPIVEPETDDTSAPKEISE